MANRISLERMIENRCFGNSKLVFARSFERAKPPHVIASHMPSRFVCKDSRRLPKIRIHHFVLILQFLSRSDKNLEVSILRRSQQTDSCGVFQPPLDSTLDPLGHFLYTRCLLLPRLTITKFWNSLEVLQMRTLRNHTVDSR
jgi:hypothetical protein